MAVLARGAVDGDRFRAEWLFTDRRGGASLSPYDSLNFGSSVGDAPEAVALNRSVIAAYLGCDRLAVMRQVHGRAVAIMDAVPADPPDADAAVTSVADLGLAVQVADCVPVLLADVEGGRVAVAHAGWRGVAADVVGAALDALDARGPVHAWIGPAICPGCYEVSVEVRDEVEAAAPGSAAVTRAGTPAVDVRAGVRGQLAARGVDATLVGGCTFEDPDLFSFRRDGVTGRQVGVIVVRSRDD
ncbi:MAG: peptidoglycan editing factor PgeF [Candidatus Nanopelagicales bacterium]